MDKRKPDNLQAKTVSQIQASLWQNNSDLPQISQYYHSKATPRVTQVLGRAIS